MTQASTPGPLMKGDIVRGPDGQIETIKSVEPDWIEVESGRGYARGFVTFVGRHPTQTAGSKRLEKDFVGSAFTVVLVVLSVCWVAAVMITTAMSFAYINYPEFREILVEQGADQ